MTRRKNPLGTLERLPKATRMWEAVYESAKERGFSEERSAQQAWGTVKRAGYYQDRDDVWRAPRRNNQTRSTRKRNQYQIADWVAFEIDGCIDGEEGENGFDRDAARSWEYTDALRATQTKFTDEANRVVRAWIEAHPKAAEDLEKSDDLDSDDDVAWNTWAAYVGHGVGFWEHMDLSDYEDLERTMRADAELKKVTDEIEEAINNMCYEAVQAARPRTGYFTNPGSNAAPTGISGPLRIESQTDGLWVVGSGLAVPVSTRGEGKALIERLRRRSNPSDVTIVEFNSIDAMADALKVMDVALRPSRHERPTVFRLDWEDKAVILEGHPDDEAVNNALAAIDYANISFDAGVMPYAANPAKGKDGSRARAAGYAFLGQAAGAVLGFGIGALVGSLAGAAVGGVPGAYVGGAMAAVTGTYVGGIGGAARGASMGSPRGQETDAAWGAGIGAAVPYVNFLTAPLGAYIATEDPKRAPNLKRRLTEE